MNKKRNLPKGTLTITDGKKPLALAGVIGGADSEVAKQTTELILESAYFDPLTVRDGAKSQGLKTDASSRFEKGVDVLGVKKAV